MTWITFSNKRAFLDVLLDLRERGIDCSGSADDTGFYYIEIPEE